MSIVNAQCYVPVHNDRSCTCVIHTGIGSNQVRVLSGEFIGPEAAGTYVCRAGNGVGSAEITLSVNIQGKRSLE